MPPFVKNDLKHYYIDNWGENIRKIDELATLFQSVQVPLIILKGAALLSSVYKSIGLRMLGDIDVLVKPHEAPKLEKILFGRGFESPYKPGSFAVTNSLNSRLYIHESPRILLHVHWHIVNNVIPNHIYPERINMDELWEDSIALKIMDVEAISLAPHHQILHLSEHAMKHSYNTLIHIWDIHQVILYWGGELDWGRVSQKAHEFGLTGPLYYSLLMSRECFDTPIPDGVINTLLPPSIGLGEQIFFSLLKRNRRREHFCLLFYLSRSFKFWEKIRFVWGVLFPYSKTLHSLEPGKDRAFFKMQWRFFFRRVLNIVFFVRKE